MGLDDGVRGLRVAFAPRLGGATPDPEVLRHVTAAAERLAALGAIVEDVGPVFDPLGPLFTDYWYAGFASRFRSIPAAKHDLLVTPTTPVTAPPVDTPYHSEVFDRWKHGTPYTVPFNLTGHPGGSSPCGVTEAGLPVGVQVVGARFDEMRVLRAMRALESSDPPAWPPKQVKATLAPLGLA
jgi:aspartyl-tRNA(Asn)/glutamyl-tRNA(Gln) amidotransferase subunit A